ncbi:class I SAM-dependent methyltransferase [Pectobacterium parmentieri]|uniref:class I SAM-dependent methyltransferase n=1 Tax=Pectobacterium parmentieri TaxID=1905730 RepID=UPI0018DFFC9A|nr:class I SAM-dependent methyltransferase [Pectobacterium parmentieri]MBI0550994.1 methyltransferase domain-containing protein [Pectobacterium parmentieri]MBI0560028.1 methyltransferase domain-containing protein [Pectobacterium parmentieri]MBI0565160.1 methyltransferase domain-containing protein [Pectobacterium parmentieri]
MIIDEIDFSALYQAHMARVARTAKTPEHWDKRAENMAVECAGPRDPYLEQFIANMNFSDAKTLLDVGCGPGSVCLNVASRLEQVYGIDYSEGMLDVARRRADAMGITNATFAHRAWEDDWANLPDCDIVVASRSTLVMDLAAALYKLNQKARLRVYTTHTVSPTFVDPRISAAIGRTSTSLPNYIYAVNILYRMGIYANVSFIRGQNCQRHAETFERFAEGVAWSLGKLNEEEIQRLRIYYDAHQHDDIPLVSPTRDWAFVYWDVVPHAEFTR